jgi:competence protein ComEA
MGGLRRRLMLLALFAAGAAPAQAPRSEPALLELNTASRAELESLPGIGPALAERLLKARQRQDFEDWADVMRRVSGIRAATAARLSAQGLRVRGQAYKATR